MFTFFEIFEKAKNFQGNSLNQKIIAGDELLGLRTFLGNYGKLQIKDNYKLFWQGEHKKQVLLRREGKNS